VFRIDKSVLQIRIRMVPHLDPDPHQSQNWSYYRCKTNFFFSGQGLFPAAAAARGADELWGLFWTEEMRELTITHTNRRIMKMMDAMGPDLLANDSGIGLVDMVSSYYFLVDKMLSCHFSFYQFSGSVNIYYGSGSAFG